MSSTDLHGPEASRREDAEPTTSALKEEPPKRRKQSQVAVVLEEYLDFRKKQSVVEEIKEPKPDEKFSIAACVSTLEEMEGLTDREKGKVLRLFKCQQNRESFINTKVASVRLCWLKEEIDAART
ncbi:hypothetical protein BRADI_5g14526v3 [Brachypodium distachyon]|uniref:Uncharacterized protein n=2 Tax=Brachypodium distachyon TaxID=15368 RepID=A0A0Q3IB83_BRADI|nr:hypothetical protein BRADI_5g14526v3 [Brachypodium distachyon]